MRLVVVTLALAVGCGSSGDEPAPVASAPAATPAPDRLPAERPPAPKPPRAPATMPRFELRVGDTLDTVLGSKLVTRPTDTMDAKITTSRKRRFEVLEVAGGLVTKAKITFPEDKQVVNVSGSDVPDRSSLEGQTFIARWRNGKHELELVGAGAFDDERERRLLDDVRAFVGQPDYVANAFAGKPLPPVGTMIALPLAEIGMALAPEATVKTALVRLIEVRGDVAVFEQVLVFSGRDRDQAYEVNGILLVEIEIPTGKRIKQSAVSTMTWFGWHFEGRDVFTYHYITPGR